LYYLFKIHLNDAQTASITKISSSLSFSKFNESYGAIINQPHKVIRWNDMFFIGDFEQKSIFVFSKDGQFLYTIATEGRGPAELIQLADFVLDEDNEEVIIWDNGAKKRVFFSVDGNFIRSEKIPTHVCNAVLLPDGSHMTYSSLLEDYDLYSYDISGEIKAKLLPVNKKMRNMPVVLNTEYFYTNEIGEILFMPGLSNIVYSITDKNVHPKYEIDFGKNKLPDTYLHKYSGNPEAIYKAFYQDIPKTDYVHTIHTFKETKEYIFFSYLYKGRFQFAIQNKLTNRTKHIKNWALDNDAMILLNTLRFFDLKGNTLYGFFQGHELFDNYHQLSINDRQKILKDIPQLKTLMNDLSDNDNLVFVQIELSGSL